jgi:hypothetical protein
MSELAFNSNGDNFDVPATVTAWRVRRMKPRGAPELVYGRDGRPLTVPIEAEIEDLRDAVGAAGKYRLDPINDDGKCVEGVPPAYVQVIAPERNAAEAVPKPTHGDDTIREAMRLNTELAKSVIDRFPEMMQAAAELLRAADGAGLPAREPRAVEDDEDDADEATASPPSPTFELINTLVAQIVPVIVTSLASKGLPKLGRVLDWRKAIPAAPQAGTTHVETKTAVVEPPVLDAAVMAKVMQIQAALTPAEQTRARMLAAELSPTELREWFAELSALDVPAALAKIRSVIGGAAS